MDFGNYRSSEKNDCQSYPSREQESRYKFIGTPKYAARATHQGRVVNRKEDMESWYYMLKKMPRTGRLIQLDKELQSQLFS
ncbi:hypothetical protein COOONC_17888 [Cooperia oncophora]